MGESSLSPPPRSEISLPSLPPQFTETLVKYQHRERALKAAAVAATVVYVDIAEVAIQVGSDSESDLFKPQGVLDSEAEYTKWMKQQAIVRETNILK